MELFSGRIGPTAIQKWNDVMYGLNNLFGVVINTTASLGQLRIVFLLLLKSSMTRFSNYFYKSNPPRCDEAKTFKNQTNEKLHLTVQVKVLS